jgi:hypothetical protein
LFLFLVGLACAFPLSLYCLYLAMLHQRAHPTMVSGAWDMAGVLIALSGFLLAGGTTVIFALHVAVRDYWLHVGSVRNLGQVYGRTDAWTVTLWGGYFLLLIGGGACLIAARRACTVVYHITPGELDELLTAALGRLGIPAKRTGSRWLLGPAQTGLLEVDGSAAMRCVTLRFRGVSPTQRADIEAELGRELVAFAAPPSPVTMWLMTASASLFTLMIFLLGMFLIIVL